MAAIEDAGMVIEWHRDGCSRRRRSRMSRGGVAPTKAAVGWVFLDHRRHDGYTIRWRRGDTVAHVLRGQQVGNHGMAEVLAPSRYRRLAGPTLPKSACLANGGCVSSEACLRRKPLTVVPAAWPSLVRRKGTGPAVVGSAAAAGSTAAGVAGAGSAGGEHPQQVKAGYARALGVGSTRVAAVDAGETCGQQ